MDLRFEMPGEIINWSVIFRFFILFIGYAWLGWAVTDGMAGAEQTKILPKLTMKIPTRILDTNNDGSLNFQAMLDINVTYQNGVFVDPF